MGLHPAPDPETHGYRAPAARRLRRGQRGAALRHQPHPARGRLHRSGSQDRRRGPAPGPLPARHRDAGRAPARHERVRGLPPHQGRSAHLLDPGAPRLAHALGRRLGGAGTGRRRRRLPHRAVRAARAAGHPPRAAARARGRDRAAGPPTGGWRSCWPSARGCCAARRTRAATPRRPTRSRTSSWPRCRTSCALPSTPSRAGSTCCARRPTTTPCAAVPSR